MEDKKTTPLVEFFETDEEFEKDEIRKKTQEVINNADGKAKPLVMVEDPNDKGKTNEFLVLLKGEYEGEEFSEWQICVGREEAYEYIKEFIEYIDLFESFIVSEKDTFKDRIRVIKFLKHVIASGKIDDPGFDPDDYIQGDYDSDDVELNE